MDREQGRDVVVNFSEIDRGSLIGRAVRWPLSLIPADARLPILQGPLRGRRWLVGSSNHGCWLGSYERSQQLLLEKWIKTGDTVFDVGAHAGFYSLLGSVLVGASGRVVAFEPVPANLTYLKEHLLINAIENVEVIEAAVSNRQGRVRMASGSSSSMWRLADQGELEVPCTSLDELVLEGKIPAPDVIKMDVEGAELLALQGAAGVMRKFRPVIILSTHGSDIHRRCCDFLESHGYDLTPIAGTVIAECRELLAVHGSVSGDLPDSKI